MKTRQGFVSNSSSSSFIVGVGKIKDIKDFKKWAKDNEVPLGSYDDYSGLRIVSTTDLVEKSSWDFGINENNDLWVEEPTNDCGRVSTPLDHSSEDLYCIVCIGNDEGDDYFWNGDDYDYAIDSSYFDGYQQDILQMLIDSKLLEKSEHNYGAGRHG